MAEGTRGVEAAWKARSTKFVTALITCSLCLSSFLACLLCLLEKALDWNLVDTYRCTKVYTDHLKLKLGAEDVRVDPENDLLAQVAPAH